MEDYGLLHMFVDIHHSFDISEVEEYVMLLFFLKGGPNVSLSPPLDQEARQGVMLATGLLQ